MYRLPAGLILVLLCVGLIFVRPTVFARDGDGWVSVSTDASSYAPGEPVTATVLNGSATPIAPLGGIVCHGSPWPFGVQWLDDAGNWQDVVFPRTPPCIGIAVALVGPGESRMQTFAADANPGTYRVVYAYTPTVGSGQAVAASDRFEVTTTPADQGTDATGSAVATLQVPALGTLDGQVSIGPLRPVEQVGVPPPTPSPAVCTARGLVVFSADTGAEAARFSLGPDCHFSVDLPAGAYRVELDRRGIDFSRSLPRTVTITAGQTTHLDIDIDTGIR